MKFFKRIVPPLEFLPREIFTMSDKIAETTNEECSDSAIEKLKIKARKNAEDERSDDSSEDTQTNEQEENEQRHTRTGTPQNHKN